MSDVTEQMDISMDQVVEALIFTSEGPMTTGQILDLFEEEEFEAYEMDEAKLLVVLEWLEKKYQEPQFICELRKVAGGYQFFTKRAFYPFAKVAAMAKSKKKLSRASLETLAIIAYRQPITKTEVEFIRGVNCDYAVHKLLEKKLLEIRGRSDAAGRPLLYGTSPYFMEYFGISDLKDLPKLDEVNLDESEFAAQFKVYLDEKEGGAETEQDERHEQGPEGDE
jgi:segregation and condensation protein B